MAEDISALGITLAGDLAEQASEPDTFPVLPENWDALQLFLALRTQWRTQGGLSASYLGLDYPALYGHPRYARLDYDAQDALLEQIQLLETGALAEWNGTAAELSRQADRQGEQRDRAALERMDKMHAQLGELQDAVAGFTA